MFAWILILIPWVALLSLILHDATKEDSDGSAISIAAKNLKALIGWAIPKARKLWRALGSAISVAAKNLKTLIGWAIPNARRLWRALNHRAPPTNVSKPAA